MVWAQDASLRRLKNGSGQDDAAAGEWPEVTLHSYLLTRLLGVRFEVDILKDSRKTLHTDGRPGR